MVVDRAIVEVLRDALGFGSFNINPRLRLAIREIDEPRGGVAIRLYVVDDNVAVAVLKESRHHYGDNTPYYMWVQEGAWVADFEAFVRNKIAGVAATTSAASTVAAAASRTKREAEARALSRYKPGGR